MARIAGIDIPREKRVEISLRYVYGIGPTNSREILAAVNVSPDTRVRNLTEEERNRIDRYVSDHYRVEGDLRREVQLNIKRLQDIGCYRGLRHRGGLPVNRPRTRTKARTKRGARKTVGGRKKAAAKK